MNLSTTSGRSFSPGDVVIDNSSWENFISDILNGFSEPPPSNGGNLNLKFYPVFFYTFYIAK